MTQLAWFAAACATGSFWYYLDQKELWPTAISAVAALFFVAIAIWLHRREDPARDGQQDPMSSAESIALNTTRRAQINAWRAAIEAEQYDYIDYRSRFLSSTTYSTLRPHLPEDIRRKVEAPRTYYVGAARGGNVRKLLLLDEIARIERQWGLL